MQPCDCHKLHAPRRVVLPGGPGAGKTAILELIRLFFCEHVKTLPEAAGIVFGGRFPRSDRPALRQAAQRAIYHVQRELESVGETENAAVVLCDRGTLDCAAYWIGDGDLFSAVNTTRAAELARYDAVIHLRHRLPRRLTIATTRCASSPSRRRQRSTDGSPRTGLDIRGASS